MIVTTTPFVPGHRVLEAKGQVFGSEIVAYGTAVVIEADAGAAQPLE